jgi:hypothetical protein
MIRLAGKATVEVPAAKDLMPPPSRCIATTPLSTGAEPRGFAFIALARAVAGVCKAVEGERHNTIVSETSRLTRLVEAGQLDAAVLRTTILTAAEQIGTPTAEAEAIIDWALKHLASPEREISDGR